MFCPNFLCPWLLFLSLFCTVILKISLWYCCHIVIHLASMVTCTGCHLLGVGLGSMFVFSHQLPETYLKANNKSFPNFYSIFCHMCSLKKSTNLLQSPGDPITKQIQQICVFKVMAPGRSLVSDNLLKLQIALLSVMTQPIQPSTSAGLFHKTQDPKRP